MSTETLIPPEQTKEVTLEGPPELFTAIGKTAFEELALSADSAVEQSDGLVDSRLINSVTHLGDGQQVPDER